MTTDPTEMSDAMHSVLGMLPDSGRQRRAFITMLKEVRREANRTGVYSIESVAREMDSIIAASD